jgi:hypothetical protein
MADELRGRRGDMGLRLFERTLASVKPDLRPLYVADAEHDSHCERSASGSI